MPETTKTREERPSDDSRTEPWSVAAVVLPFVLGFAAITAAIIALVNLKQHPHREGRLLAWAGIAMCSAHLAGFIYVLVMMKTL